MQKQSLFKWKNVGRWVTALALIASMGALDAARAAAVVPIVATIPELAAIAKEVGGNKVSVYSVARPNRDYHTIEPRPSDVSRVAQAKLVVRTGMQFEMWMDSMANATGNVNLTPGGPGYVNCSLGIKREGMPTTQITGASGDIHIDGNPHFYYDPIYAKFIARNVLKGLLRVDPANAETYRANYTHFNAEIDRRMPGWQKELAPYIGKSVVTYHENFAYFIRRFGLREYGHLEPKPGIPPSAAHINALIQNMKRDGVRAVVIESIYPTRFADVISQQTGAKYVVAPYSIGALGTTDYFSLIDKLVSSFKQALSH
ncbi:MAG: zinc ABC transporter substrate-binding protein [Abitibacteriaceae bacterium]|nr:zinc ABC transporter substrate-binding protein [Abditibacteriaceae bacterium]